MDDGWEMVPAVVSGSLDGVVLAVEAKTPDVTTVVEFPATAEGLSVLSALVSSLPEILVRSSEMWADTDEERAAAKFVAEWFAAGDESES